MKPTVSVPPTPRTEVVVTVGAKGATRLKISPGFTRVKNLYNDKEGVVQDVLSEQVTVYYDDMSGMDFFFRKYYKLDWELVT
jgi:hypothetical protein